MTTIQRHDPGPSPFDAIRRTRPDGSEFWSARELMPLMGYDRWERFMDAIDRARAAAGNVGADVEGLFRGTAKKSTGGRPGLDIELSRFAAYLVAMNGDSRKPEVAASQAYFAVRTHEAETRPAAHPDLVTRSDLARMVLESEEEKAVLAAALESAAPAIEYHERFVIEDDVVTVKAWGAQFGLTEPQARAALLDHKVIYKAHLGTRWSGTKQAREDVYEYRAYAGYLPMFDLRPQHNAPRHHNGQVRQTLYIRQEHALTIGRKCGLAPVGQQGQLEIGGAS